MGVIQIQQGKVGARAQPSTPSRSAASSASRCARSKEGLARGGRDAPHARAADRAARARSGATPRTSTRLRDILARMEAALGDMPRWIEADLDFHETIAAMSRQPAAAPADAGAAADPARDDGAVQRAPHAHRRRTGARPSSAMSRVVDGDPGRRRAKRRMPRDDATTSKRPTDAIARDLRAAATRGRPPDENERAREETTMTQSDRRTRSLAPARRRRSASAAGRARAQAGGR